MHMADALISPAVGGVMWAATAAVGAVSVRALARSKDERRLPLMGVMGAFVFAAQMINFSIPGTGSSGHLGGGLLLSALLGPYAGFLVMASVLAVQALFFADGGLLAFGCNVFNLGFFTCFIAYPLIFKPLAKRSFRTGTVVGASLVAGIVGLQLGAFSVVLETLLSGRTELPFGTFALLMQPIHLAIGVVEGLATAAILAAVHRARPEVLSSSLEDAPYRGAPLRPLVLGGILLALIAGGILSWFASAWPDGLEWSMARTSGAEELQAPGGVHGTFASVQERTAFLPDYGFRATEPSTQPFEPPAESGESGRTWPVVNAGTSLSGVLGAGIVFTIVALAGLAGRLIRRKSRRADA
jgi:cobalt/nickel transport system permease protein